MPLLMKKLNGYVSCIYCKKERTCPQDICVFRLVHKMHVRNIVYFTKGIKKICLILKLRQNIDKNCYLFMKNEPYKSTYITKER